MRGLDARVLIAHHRLALVAGLDGEEEMLRARDSARAQGYHDAQQGYDDLPVMFKDEPDLLAGWQDGQNRYWLNQEIPFD